MANLSKSKQLFTRIFTLIICLFAFIALTACGDNGNNPESPNNNSPNLTTTTKTALNDISAITTKTEIVNTCFPTNKAADVTASVNSKLTQENLTQKTLNS